MKVKTTTLFFWRSTSSINEMVTILIISYIAICIVGVFLHFTHGIFKKGRILHIVSTINESTWEHTKLAFYPVLVALTIHSLIKPFAMYNYFWGIAFMVLICSIVAIPMLYYPIKYIIKKEITIISIGIYFIDVLLCLLLEYYLLEIDFSTISPQFGIAGTIILIIIYAIFTYFPPKHPIFKDPIFKKFGEFKQSFD